LIAARYKNDIEAFNKNCRQLGGIPLDMADASYGFKIAPRIPVAALYWAGDHEFPPESKLLFDKSISEHLALDIIFASAVDVYARIGSLGIKNTISGYIHPYTRLGILVSCPASPPNGQNWLKIWIWF
jgi:Domain of unknown function (DUF3786)